MNKAAPAILTLVLGFTGAVGCGDSDTNWIASAEEQVLGLFAMDFQSTNPNPAQDMRHYRFWKENGVGKHLGGVSTDNGATWCRRTADWQVDPNDYKEAANDIGFDYFLLRFTFTAESCGNPPGAKMHFYVMPLYWGGQFDSFQPYKPLVAGQPVVWEGRWDKDPSEWPGPVTVCGERGDPNAVCGGVYDGAGTMTDPSSGG